MRDAILYGSGGEAGRDALRRRHAQLQTTKPFEGVIPNLERRWQETDSSWVREELERYQTEQPCEVCNGARLKPEALAVKIGGLHISQVTELVDPRRRSNGSATLTGAADRQAERDRRSASSRRSTSGWASSTMSAWTT